MEFETGTKRTGGDQSPTPQSKRFRFDDGAVLPILRDLVDEHYAARPAPVEVASVPTPATTVAVTALSADHLAIVDAIDMLHRLEPALPLFLRKPSQLKVDTLIQLAEEIHNMDVALTATTLQRRRLLMFSLRTAMSLGLVPLACALLELLAYLIKHGPITDLESWIAEDRLVTLLLTCDCPSMWPLYKVLTTQPAVVAARVALDALFRRVTFASRPARRQAMDQLLLRMVQYSGNDDRHDIDLLGCRYLLELVNDNEDNGALLLEGEPDNSDIDVRAMLKTMVHVANKASAGRLEAIHNACTLMSTLARMAKAKSTENAWPSWIGLYKKACRDVWRAVGDWDYDELEELTVTLMLNRGTLSSMK